MENKNVFEKTVETLITDAVSLTKRYHKLIDSNNPRESTREAIDTLRLLKDTLSLIKEYDWHLEYSESDIGCNSIVTIWEQNHAGETRNYKMWNVSNKKNDIKNKWEDLLRIFIENKQSMLYELSYDKDAEKEHRGTGKSTVIEKLATEYDLPIFTSQFRAQNYNKNMSLRQFKNKTSKAYYCWNNFRGSNDYYNYSTIILVDEGFEDSDMYDSIINDCGFILIGFKPVK